VREFLFTITKCLSSDTIKDGRNFENPLLRQQSINTNGTTSVNTASRDADFSTETEAVTVSHACGGILEDASGVDSVEEGLADVFVIGEDGVSVVRTVSIDVLDGGGGAVDDFDGHAIVTVFGLEAVAGFGKFTREGSTGDGATKELDAGVGELSEELSD